jgi:hypothetical protein
VNDLKKTMYPFVISLMFLLIGCSSTVESGISTNTGQVTITKAEYDQLKNGMTPEEVAAIIGGSGEIESENGGLGDDYYSVIYSYNGVEQFTYSRIMFSNNKLIKKSQTGLK